MIELAFYCGEGTWLDRLIRWTTRSRFSHVELVVSRAGDVVFTGGSSSPRDGGVRFKRILIEPGHWEFVTVPGDQAAAIAAITGQLGLGYDFLGLFLSHVLALHRDSSTKWSCSELVACAIGRKNLAGLAPGTLYDVLRDENERFSPSSTLEPPHAA